MENTELVSGDFDAGTSNVGFTAIVQADPFEVLRYELTELGRYTDDGYRPHARPVPVLPAYGETLAEELAEAVRHELDLMYPAGPDGDPRDHYENWLDDQFSR